MVTGSRVTGSPWSQGHHNPGYRVTPYPSPWVSGLGLLWSRVTGYHGYRVIGHRVTGLSSPWSWVLWLLGLGSRVTGSPWSQGHRVTGLPWSPWVTGHHGSQGYHGHHGSQGHHGLPSPSPGLPWSQGHPSPGRSNLPSSGLQGYHHHGFGSHITRVLPWGGVTFGSYQHTIFKIVEG